MKRKTIQFAFPFKKSLAIGILLLCGLLLGSNKSSACTASFTYTAGANGHYTFTSTSVGVGPGTQYFWNPGDGSGWHYSRLTFAYTYTANATYNARLAIGDSSCIDTSAATSITVTNVVGPCLLSASFTSSVGAHGVVTFTSTSGDTIANTQYYWAPGDSNQRIHGASKFVHTYLYQGMYGVWLTVEDTGNQYCLDSIYEWINVPTADSSHCHIHANFTYTQGANGQITFTNTSTGTQPGDQYTWVLGDTAGTHNGQGPFSYTYNFNDTYSVKLVVIGDSNACSDSITIPVTVTSACNMVPSFTVAYDSNGQVKFTSTSAGVSASTIYKWTFGDGTPTLTWYDTATHAYSFIGYYNVTLTDSNPSGCVASSTQQVYIYNKDSLQACFTYALDSLHAGTYNFNAACSQGTDGYTYYKWTPGDGDPSDSGVGMRTYTHTYLLNGPYSATLTIWYTVLPHKATRLGDPRFDESSYTQVINVTGATGVQSLIDSKVYNVYPNPNNGSFNIAVSGVTGAQNALVRVSNMMGQVIYQANTNVNGNMLIPVNMGTDVSNGIYLLQIITQDNTYTSRIAIQR